MKVYIVTTENVIKSIHTSKSSKEWWKINKLQLNKEEMNGKEGAKIHETNFYMRIRYEGRLV